VFHLTVLVILFYLAANTWRKGFYSNNSLPLVVPHTCRIEGTL